jgi:hypothetical protein
VFGRDDQTQRVVLTAVGTISKSRRVPESTKTLREFIMI